MESKEIDKKLQMKIMKKQKHITTNADLSKYNYIRNGKDNNIQMWKHRISKAEMDILKLKRNQKDLTTKIIFNFEELDENLQEKIKQKQNVITTDTNISEFDYMRMGFSHGIGKQQWIFKSYANEAQKKYYKTSQKEQARAKAYRKLYNQSHKKEHAESMRKWREKNPDKSKAISIKFRKSMKGKISEAKHSAKRYKKGFVLLFELNDKSIKTEFHHVHPNLPYTIPVPTEIHKSINGRNPNHYLGVVANFYRWLEEHPEIRIKELVE